MSIALSDLGAYERSAIINYLSSNAVRLEGLKTELTEGGLIALDVSFPEDFFDVLAERSEGERRDGPRPRGLKCQSWIAKNIAKYYEYRWTQFHLEYALPSHHIATTNSVNDTSVYLFQFMTKEMGMDSLVRRYAGDLLDGVRAYRSSDLFIQLFGALLHSGSYDTVDVKAYLSWTSVLGEYEISAQSPNGNYSQPHVRLRDVPYLLRKCLLPNQTAAGTLPHMLPVVTSKSTWRRCRSALTSWCDAHGRVPGVVSDPKFYIPPFSASNPYLGVTTGTAEAEGRFITFEGHVVVPSIQLLTLMLINFRANRDT